MTQQDKQPVTVTLPSDIKETIERNAAAAHRTVAGEIRHLIAIAMRQGQDGAAL